MFICLIFSAVDVPGWGIRSQAQKLWHEQYVLRPIIARVGKEREVQVGLGFPEQK